MRTRKVDKRRWYFAGFNVLLVLLAAVCAAIFVWMTGVLPSLDTAQRWRGGSETAFTQVACFLPVDDTRSVEQVESKAVSVGANAFRQCDQLKTVVLPEAVFFGFSSFYSCRYPFSSTF